MQTRRILTPEEPKICRNPDHNPPAHQVLDPGTYEHTCPGCGYVTTFRIQKLVSW